jgi:hypothetical protein
MAPEAGRGGGLILVKTTPLWNRGIKKANRGISLVQASLVKAVQAIAFANGCEFGAQRLNTKEQLISDLGSRLVDDYNATRPQLDAALCMWRVGHWLRTGRYVQTVVEQDDDHNDCLYTRPTDRRVWVDAAVDHAVSTELSTRL